MNVCRLPSLDASPILLWSDTSELKKNSRNQDASFHLFLQIFTTSSKKPMFVVQSWIPCQVYKASGLILASKTINQIGEI